MIRCSWCNFALKHKYNARGAWNADLTMHLRCEKQKQIFESVEIPTVQNPKVFLGLGNKNNPLGVKSKKICV